MTAPSPDHDPSPAARRKARKQIWLWILHKVTPHTTTLIALAVRAGAVLAGFAVTFVIGNRMGAAANGQFALVSQTAMFLSVVGLVGLDVGVVRHFARAVALKIPVAATALLKVGALGTCCMLTIALVLWLGGQQVWEPLFGTAVPRTLLPVLCVLLFARGGTQLLGGLLRSQHRFTLGQVIAALTIPAGTAIALLAGLAGTVEQALWVAAAGGMVSMLVGVGAMRRHVARGSEALDVGLRPLFTSSLPLWGVGIANNIGDWYGLAVAAQMLSAADAGVYRVGAQIAATLQIISIAIFSVYSAKISTAFHADDLAQVARLARTSVRLSTLTAVPTAALLMVASPFLLDQIGPEFAGAFALIAILVIGQLAFTLTGPCGLVLAMSGNERINLAITVAGTLVLLMAVPVAAKFGGLPGIAVCTSTVMLLRNIIAYGVVRSKLGIGIWSGAVRA